MKKLFLLFAVAGFMTSCMTNNAGNDKTAANIAKVQRFYDEVINAHNPAVVDSFCTADFTDHNPSPGHSGKGLDDLKSQFNQFFSEFPDVHMATQAMTGKGDTVMVWITMTGTNSGPLGSMPASNKTFSVMGSDIIVIKDGKATDRWGYSEEMKMMQQLGLMPTTGAMPDSSAKK